MPPRAIAVQVRSTASSGNTSPVRSWARSSASSSADGGNFGATAEPAAGGVLFAQHAGHGVITQRGLHRRPATRQSGRHRPQLTGDLIRGLFDLVAPSAPGLGDRREQLQETGFRVVGAAEERSAVGRQEARHRPAALTGQRDRGVHVDRVEVRPFLAIHLMHTKPAFIAAATSSSSKDSWAIT